jgi:hypothetical protein
VLIASVVIRKDFSEALTTFIPFWTQCSSPASAQNVNRLAMAFKARMSLEEKVSTTTDESNLEAVAAIEIGNITDLPVANNRASLFVFLSSLVCLFYMLMP